MGRIVIIADDLTGSNATGVLLARKGYTTATFLQLDMDDTEQYAGYDVIAINTDSRAIDAQEAYRRVAEAAATMRKGAPLMFAKRIDSTLRGNLGAETDAVLDVLGDESMAVVVAAFPASGRVTIGGYLLVHGVPLEKTDVARDPKTPVRGSIVTELFAAQSKYPVGHIPLTVTLQGKEAVTTALLEHQQAGRRLVVMDATTQVDLETIAQGALATKLPIIAVDPGPFTMALASCLLPPPVRGRGQKVFLAVGSATPLARRQLKEVENSYRSYLAFVDARALINPERVEGEVDRVASEIMGQLEEFPVLGIRTMRDESDRLNLTQVAQQWAITEEEVTTRITAGLARITAAVVARARGEVGGLYTSGGDVTVAVCRALEAAAIEVKDEVVPLAAYGRLIGGSYPGMPIITKGGLVGDDQAICNCVDYLLTKISNEVYPAVPAT